MFESLWVTIFVLTIHLYFEQLKIGFLGPYYFSAFALGLKVAGTSGTQIVGVFEVVLHDVSDAIDGSNRQVTI